MPRMLRDVSVIELVDGVRQLDDLGFVGRGDRQPLLAELDSHGRRFLHRDRRLGLTRFDRRRIRRLLRVGRRVRRLLRIGRRRLAFRRRVHRATRNGDHGRGGGGVIRLDFLDHHRRRGRGVEGDDDPEAVTTRLAHIVARFGIDVGGAGGDAECKGGMLGDDGGTDGVQRAGVDRHRAVTADAADAHRALQPALFRADPSIDDPRQVDVDLTKGVDHRHIVVRLGVGDFNATRRVGFDGLGRRA